MKRWLCMIIMLLTAIVTVANVAFAAKDEFDYSLDNLPEGVYIRSEVDTNVLFSTGMWLKIFEIEQTPEHKSAIRVELINDRTGENRTIYWQIGTLESLVSWPEENFGTVIINGVPIQLDGGSYDCRDYRNFKYKPQTENETDNGF